MKKILKISAFLICVFALFIALSAIYLNIVTADSKLNADDLISNSASLTFYDDLGEVFYTSNASGKEYVNFTDIPDNLINAFISIEDKRFYKHKGVDYLRILGATKNNILSMSLKEGASTISQQLVKNSFLSSEKTFKRKFAEIKLAKELEKKYDKSEILEMYLNSIYFGGGNYGIGDASKYYFDKSVKDLTLNECAYLAAIVKSPSKYSPKLNPNFAFSRKNLVLKSMLDGGYISESEYEENHTLEYVSTTSENYNAYHDYVEECEKELTNLKIFNPYNGSNDYKIYTYLDTATQRKISEIQVEGLENISKTEIIINPKNYGVSAYFGYNSNNKRSPASCIKPWYIYAPCINEKLVTEQTKILDDKTDFNGYTPSNFGDKFYGYVTIKESLSKSLNVPSVKLLETLGYNKANEYSNKLNYSVGENYLANALGAVDNEMSLKDLLNKYVVFCNGGKYSDCKFIKKITLNDSEIYDRKIDEKSVFSEGTAYIINDILCDCSKNGTAKKLNVLPYQLCAKTGTNGNDKGNIDAYSIAYTPDKIVGVWLGNIDGSLMPNNVTGGNHPTIIAREIIECLYKNSIPYYFTKPSEIKEVKLSEKALKDNQLLIDDNSNITGYFLNGTEPTEYAESSYKPKLNNVEISVNNRNISLRFDNYSADYIVIKRINNGVKTLIYDGKTTTDYQDKITLDGIYNYEITPYVLINGKKVFGQIITTKSISVESNGKVLNSEWWQN